MAGKKLLSSVRQLSHAGSENAVTLDQCETILAGAGQISFLSIPAHLNTIASVRPQAGSWGASQQVPASMCPPGLLLSNHVFCSLPETND